MQYCILYIPKKNLEKGTSKITRDYVVRQTKNTNLTSKRFNICPLKMQKDFLAFDEPRTKTQPLKLYKYKINYLQLKRKQTPLLELSRNTVCTTRCVTSKLKSGLQLTLLHR